MTFKRNVFIAALSGFGALAIAFWLWGDRLPEMGRESVEDWVAAISAMGPVIFFGALALLPLSGFPTSFFLLTAGAAFGLAEGVIGSILALSLNMILAWALSGKFFRPWFERFLSRMGYRPLELSSRRLIDLAILLRITPGMPFVIQNYTLGLSGMPLVPYLLVSVPLNGLMAAGIVLMGDAILAGDGLLVMVSVFVLVAVAIAIRILRERMTAKTEIQKI